MMSVIDPHLDLSEARATISAPDHQPIEALRAAIAVLKAHGDWMDFERARMLARQLDGDSFGPFLDAMDVVTMFVAVIGGLWLGDFMGWL